MSASPAAVPPSAPARACSGLFVSTALDYWSTEQATAFARDVQVDDVAYRRLDPEYYAWLRSRMLLAKKAADAGHLTAAAFEDLRVRFNAVHEWAVQHFGEEQLLAAVRPIHAREYTPPVTDEELPGTPLPRTRRSAGQIVPPEAIAMVNAVCDRALSLGWKRERLYATGNGHFDPHRGLVCFLKAGDRIGEVTAQSIEIIHALPEVRHRFYNPDVDQPWIIRTGSQEK